MEKFSFDDLLFEDLVLLDFEANDQEDLIEKMCAVLEEKEYVKADYSKDVINREKKYPTALPTEVLKVAIPHAETNENVIHPAILIAKLKKPVEFLEMGSLGKKVNVDAVFLLAVKGNKSQLEILPKLISVFSEHEMMSKLKASKNPSEIVTIIKNLSA